MGIIGALANSLIIKSKLNEIFHYREQALIKRYGKWSRN